MKVRVKKNIANYSDVPIASFTGTFEVYIDPCVQDMEKVFIRFKGSSDITNRSVDKGIPPRTFKRLLREGIIEICA
ncbi:MAG TPA: hypothetical protein PKL44_00485 [Candidatus Dojkabacteria bacterium]|nr:hypothetical protein [Candidatus Dojkabacteria bacterium]